MTQIRTQRLTLHPVQDTDFSDLVSLWRNTDFTTHITGRALSEEEVWFRLLRDVGHWQVKGYGNWSLRLIETGEYVGSVGLLDYRRTLDAPFDAPEIGWGIHPRHQGQGLASEAIKAALDWRDANLEGERTVCMISPQNQPSIRLAARHHFEAYDQARYMNSEVKLYARRRGLPRVIS